MADASSAVPDPVDLATRTTGIEIVEESVLPERIMPSASVAEPSNAVSVSVIVSMTPTDPET